MADTVGTGRIKLVETIRTMDNQRGFRAQFIQDLRERLGKPGIIDSGQLDVCSSRIGKRTKNIKDRALTDLLARTNGVFHRRMKFGCEHETNANLPNGLRELFRCELEVVAECGED